MSFGNTRYSGKIISKVITGANGEERLYKARKISAFPLAREGFKLLKVFAPMLGTGADSMVSKQRLEDEFIEADTNTFGNMMTMLDAHLDPDHFMDLVEKLMGSLMLGDKQITDFDDHFDNYNGDFLEVVCWLMVENFKGFFMESAMIRSLIEKTLSLASPKMKEMWQDLKNGLVEEAS
jgi:hypothetical protein